MSHDFSFLNGDTVAAAQRLLGCYLVRTLPTGNKIVGKIVETEAYTQTDAASHSYKGQTPRTDVMFGPAGRAYVYFTYGMHYCVNVATGKEGEGAAILIRALELVDGKEFAEEHRAATGVNLANGPAKLCQAMAIAKETNGHDLHHEPLELVINPPLPADAIAQTARIGITQDADRPWRFYIKDNEWVSRA